VQSPHVKSAKLEVLRNIEPIQQLALHCCLARTSETVPKVQVVHRSLLISHEYVKGKEVERGYGLATKHLEQVREAIAVEVRRG